MNGRPYISKPIIGNAKTLIYSLHTNFITLYSTNNKIEVTASHLSSCGMNDRLSIY